MVWKKSAFGMTRVSPTLGGARFGDDLSTNEIHRGGEEHEHHKPRLPPAVEEIARAQEEEVPPLGKEIIDQQDDRKEIKEEDVGGENHLGSTG